ncbi:MAG: macro domain-containing protein [Erysipelotrichaceae bacterium]|nr:macro domain-containing protein [Erysipelotrichaceae bacterium]
MPLSIIQGDITQQKCDAIVNAANSYLQAGGGVCGAIFRAAGQKELQKLCDQLGTCPTGSAVYTDGLELCRYIIHAVGPVYHDGAHGEEQLLYGAYRSALKIADELKIESVAFPLISSGIYGYPRDDAFRIAVRAIGDYLLESDLDVRLVIFDDPSSYLKEKQREISLLSQPVYSPNVSERERRKAAGRKWEGNTSAASLAGAARETDEQYSEHLSMVVLDNEYDRDSAQPYSFGIVHHQPAEFKVNEDTFSDALFKIIDEKEMLDPDVYRRANLDRKLFSKIRSDRNYQPSRNTAIALAIALKLNFAEANRLLERAGYRIGQSTMADVIISHCFAEQIYNIHEVNELLFVHGQKTLGSYGD